MRIWILSLIIRTATATWPKVLIITTRYPEHQSPECTTKFLPFPAICVQCHSWIDKPQCTLSAIKNIKDLSDDDLIIFADDDVVFSGWSVERLSNTLNKTPDKVIFSGQYNMWPFFSSYYPSEIKHVSPPQYLCGGFFIGKATVVSSLLSHVSALIDDIFIALAERDDRKTSQLVSYLQMPNPNHFGADQGIFGYFMMNSFGKPIILDTNHDLCYTTTDLEFYFPTDGDCSKSYYNSDDYCSGFFKDARIRIFNREGARQCRHYPTSTKADCTDMFTFEGCSIKRSASNISDGRQSIQELDSFAYHSNTNLMKPTFQAMVQKQLALCNKSGFAWQRDSSCVKKADASVFVVRQALRIRHVGLWTVMINQYLNL